VKEQVTGRYAEALSRAGFATLAFDHRGFGESGGRRQHEDSGGKLADLRSAVSALATHPQVDAERIGLVGVCLGAGYALRAAAFDPRVRAVAGVAGAYNDPRSFVRQLGADAYKQALAGLLGIEQEQFASGEERHVLAVTDDPDTAAAMTGAEPHAYYGTDRGAAPGWQNYVTQDSLYQLMTLDTITAASMLHDTPLLVVHGRTDTYCTPDGALAMLNQVTGEKEIVWLETTNHIDLYDQEPYVGQAVDALAAFFGRRLAPLAATV
jgi:fermentation-respiration switch protein FrsA (DUF1100 family)